MLAVALSHGGLVRAVTGLLIVLGAPREAAAQNALAVARDANVAVLQLDHRALVVIDTCGAVLARMAHTVAPAALEVTRSGELVSALSLDGELVLWTWRSGTVVRSLPFGAGAITDRNRRNLDELHFSPDGQRLLVGVRGTRVQVVDTQGVVVGTIDGVRPLASCASIVWDSAGERLAHANEVGVALLDGRTLVPLQAEAGAPCGQRWPARVECLEFHPSAPHLATGHADGRIHVTDVNTGSEVRSFAHDDPFYGPPPKEEVDDPFGERPWIGWLAYSRDGTRLAYTSASGVYLGCFELAHSKRIALSPYGDGRAGTPAAIEWGPRDQRVYYGFCEGAGKLSLVDLAGSARYGTLDFSWTTVPCFGNETVGFFLDRRTLRAIDGLTGEVLWSRSEHDLLESPIAGAEAAKSPR